MKVWKRGAAALVTAVLLSTAQSVGGQTPPDVTGTWALALEGAFAAQSWTLEVGREDGALTATLIMGEMGKQRLDAVERVGRTVTGRFTANMHGQEMHVTVTTTMDGDTCAGTVAGFPMGEIAYTGRRKGG